MLLFETQNPNVLGVGKIISCDSIQDFDRWSEKAGIVLDMLHKNASDSGSSAAFHLNVFMCHMDNYEPAAKYAASFTFCFGWSSYSDWGMCGNSGLRGVCVWTAWGWSNGGLHSLVACNFIRVYILLARSVARMMDVRVISGRTSLGKPRSVYRREVSTKERHRNGMRKWEPLCFRTQSYLPLIFFCNTPMNVGV